MKNSSFILLIVLFACSKDNSIDIQGHRGARGLMPENSIPGFILATQLGVTTLELDLVVSGDNKIVVSHEPYFSPEFCGDSLGNKIPKDTVINIYQLTYEQIQMYDCGSFGNERFSQQENLRTSKPLLKDVIDSVESFLAKHSLSPVNYNIELKTTEETDDVFHPIPEEFSDLVYSLLSKKNILNRVTIQSFDFRTIKYFHKKYPEVRLAMLIENNKLWKDNLHSLGFTPEVYSCYYELLSQKNIAEIQKAGMKVIPWTVNESSDIKKLIDWGVDGIITDYPNRAIEIVKTN